MRPVLGGVPGQFLPSLHDEDAGIADLAGPLVGQLEAGGAVRLVFTAVGETGTGKNIGIKNLILLVHFQELVLKLLKTNNMMEKI